jgi:hypothetical protein
LFHQQKKQKKKNAPAPLINEKERIRGGKGNRDVEEVKRNILQEEKREENDAEYYSRFI